MQLVEYEYEEMQFDSIPVATAIFVVALFTTCCWILLILSLYDCVTQIRSVISYESKQTWL